MPRRDRDSDATQARPGFRLTHQGNDIGVIEYVENAAFTSGGTLHVRGGISGCLEYVIPASAVVAVHPAARSAEIGPDVTFEPEVVAHNGRVLLIARGQSLDAHASPPRERLTPACLGFRVRADDGFLGWVEAVFCRERHQVDYLSVRARRFIRHRRLVIDSARVVTSDELHGVVVVAGTRRDLLLLRHTMPRGSWIAPTDRRLR